MAEIKPIETIYNGYRFRSRLEARWAVFFDALGVRYEYEPEGFSNNGYSYLPDFLIYDVEGIHSCPWRQNIYVEVKGCPDSESANKVNYNSALYYDGNDIIGGIPIWVVGDIPNPKDYISDMEKQRDRRCREELKGIPNKCALCINDFGTLDGDCCFGFSIDYTDHLIFHGADGSYDYGHWSEKVSNAFRMARQARFEHGEKPVAMGVF